MARKVPSFKASPSSKTCNGSAMAFNDAKIKGAKTVETNGRRAGFSKKQYTVNCGKGNLPKG